MGRSSSCGSSTPTSRTRRVTPASSPPPYRSPPPPGLHPYPFSPCLLGGPQLNAGGRPAGRFGSRPWPRAWLPAFYCGGAGVSFGGAGVRFLRGHGGGAAILTCCAHAPAAAAAVVRGGGGVDGWVRGRVWAWGSTGHRAVRRAAAEPDGQLPAGADGAHHGQPERGAAPSVGPARRGGMWIIIDIRSTVIC